VSALEVAEGARKEAPPRPDLFPSPDEFCALARSHAIVPVWTEVVADTLTPVAAYMHLVGDGVGFLFESVVGGERWGRFSFVGRAPLATMVSRGRAVTTSGPLALEVRPDGGVLEALEQLLSAFRSPVLDGLPPLHGGLVGYLGYDVVREVEHLPDCPPDDFGFPDAALMVIGQLAAFDHWRQRVVLIEIVVTDPQWSAPDALAAYEAAEGRLADLAEDCFKAVALRPIPAPRSGTVPAPARRTMSSEQFMAAVDAAKEYITAGDIFQVVLSQRFDLDLDAPSFDVYRASSTRVPTSTTCASRR
jgi:anthranilate synthase component 1